MLPNKLYQLETMRGELWHDLDQHGQVSVLCCEQLHL